MSVLMNNDEMMILESVNGTGIRLMLDYFPKDIDEATKILLNYDINYVGISNTYRGSIDWFINHVSNIEEMNILSPDVEVNGINNLDKLRVLRIHTEKKISLDFNKLKNLIYLQTLWQDSLVESFKTPSNIIGLDLRYYKHKDLKVLSNQKNIEEISVSFANKLESLDGIERIDYLNFIEIYSSRIFHDFSQINGHKNLSYLTLMKCNKISEIPTIKDTKIKEFFIDCKSLLSLEPLKSWKELEKLGFTSKVLDNDTAVLLKIPSLKFVHFTNKSGYNLKINKIIKEFKGKGIDTESYSVFRNIRTIQSYRTNCE